MKNTNTTQSKYINHGDHWSRVDIDTPIHFEATEDSFFEVLFKELKEIISEHNDQVDEREAA